LEFRAEGLGFRARNDLAADDDSLQSVDAYGRQYRRDIGGFLQIKKRTVPQGWP